jgi:hypothetical protein
MLASGRIRLEDLCKIRREIPLVFTKAGAFNLARFAGAVEPAVAEMTCRQNIAIY